jgi:hypothetical protein
VVGPTLLDSYVSIKAGGRKAMRQEMSFIVQRGQCNEKIRKYFAMIKEHILILAEQVASYKQSCLTAVGS